MLFSSRELNQIVEDCFTGQGEQSCDTCPASRDNGGPCCFGVPDEHDPRDRQCQDCPYFYECRDYVRKLKNSAGVGTYKQYTSPSSNPGAYHSPRVIPISSERKPIVQVATNRQTPYLSQRAFSISPTDEAIERAIAVRERDGSLGSRFLKDAVWFGARGVFEYGFWFFDTYRLP